MASDTGQEPYKSPDFCQGYANPKFKVLSKTDDYELREYEATKWVATTKEIPQITHSNSSMFFSLFKYIRGKNSENKAINMTVPVTTKIDKESGDTGPCKMTMRFFLETDQNPKPTADDVFLAEEEPFKVYVRSFSGFAKDKNWKENAEILKNAVPKDTYDPSHYYIAGYNSPFKLFNRHNEVWLPVKHHEDHHDQQHQQQQQQQQTEPQQQQQQQEDEVKQAEDK
ncbi:Hypothetical predicted protein [Octopus vulgaris]|uniref:Heme-binding protein 1 n=1 Tax=Octopus vulgaris TaxID=6645 RepID=A0AA36FNA0_OCTVU|nr:Hypothetical predicted protein [Octopus vulgaris]